MDEVTPPAPPVGMQTSAPSVATPAAPAEPLPTIRDHAERLELENWQVGTVIARLHGAHVDGKRVYPDGVSLNTRMSDTEFDAAVEALDGRI